MAVSIEDVLLARSLKDQEDQMSGSTAAIAGAGLGGVAGISLGDLSQRLRPQTQMSTMPPKGVAYKLKPGHRMAGGLVGMILGGALGAGTRAMMTNQSPAAQLLAKLQVQGELNAIDQQALQSVFADTYTNTLAM